MYDLFFIKRHYLLLKRSTSLLVERDMQESLKMANTKDKVRREKLFMVYYLCSSFLFIEWHYWLLKAKSSMLTERDVKGSSTTESLNKVRRDIIYGLLFAFIFSLYRMTLLTFEGKKFDDDGTIREEGEFKDGELNG